MPTSASTKVAVMLRQKMRNRARVSIAPARPAGGRNHIETLASMNGSSINHIARAAAPAVRFPQRYPSSCAPPGPVVSPYAGRGRWKPASWSPATGCNSGRSKMDSADAPDTPCTRSSVTMTGD